MKLTMIRISHNRDRYYQVNERKLTEGQLTEIP